MKTNLLASAAVLGLLCTGGASVGETAAKGSPSSCPSGALSEARLAKGAQAHDPNSVTAVQAAALDADLRQRLAKLGQPDGVQPLAPNSIRVDVRVHVITKNDGTGGVTSNMIIRQINTLNRGYSGQSNPAHAARTPFWFVLKSIDHTANSDWYNWSYPGRDRHDDREAKAALHEGGWKDLNMYVANLGDGLLGYANYPGGKLFRDGVVLLNESLPGGDAAPYNEGDTATHEVGHWFGLFHTFQNGCDNPGDRVADTPYQDNGDNIFSCEESLDTCPSKQGRDPVHNFMSYGDDPCLDRFTAGQSLRMSNVWVAYRAGD